MAVYELVWEQTVGQDGQPVESRSAYNSAEEALLQAAHNAMLGVGGRQRVEVDGKPTHGKAEIAAAGKRLKKAREDHRATLERGPDELGAIKAV